MRNENPASMLSDFSIRPRCNFFQAVTAGLETVHIIETGGTFASLPSGSGLRPALSLQQIVEEYVPQAAKLATLSYAEKGTALDFGDLIDSTNLGPKEWLRIVDILAVILRAPDCKSCVVTIGTDTLAYAASAVALMIRNPSKAIVFTGSQRTFLDPAGDATKNFEDALLASRLLPGGVYVVFNGRIIEAIRAVKIDNKKLDAFRSVAGQDVGTVVSGKGIELDTAYQFFAQHKPMQIMKEFSSAVKFETLIPGYDASDLENILADDRYKGVVIEGYGAGNLPHALLPVIKKYAQRKPIVMKTQVLFGETDMTEYETGELARQSGVWSAYGLSREAVSFALRQVLALGNTFEEQKILWQRLMDSICPFNMPQ